MNKMNTQDVREDQNNGSVNKQTYSIDHKNIELLRYYISRDMQRIQEKVDNDNNNLLGYFVASLVDVLIVSLFQDGLKQLNIIYRILLIGVFVFLFYVTYKVVNCFRRRRKQKKKTAGRDTDKPQEIIRIVDEFDNIAMDGLLLCIYYRDKCKEESDEKLRRFYFCECFHYLDKSCSVYRKIAIEKSKYVDTIDSQLISKYRVDNFLDIAKELASFTKENDSLVSDDGLEKQVLNVLEDIEKWKNAKQ